MTCLSTSSIVITVSSQMAAIPLGYSSLCLDFAAKRVLEAARETISKVVSVFINFIFYMLLVGILMDWNDRSS